MLQRAASNAYSWWWASNIRTKQSKWLDNNLQDMEQTVKAMLELLTEEADSFSKRAEMYYHRRPEVIEQVEDVYRQYKALAERYDKMSAELHKANHTIATAFPDQVQYAMLEDDDDNVPKAITTVDPRKIHKSTVDGLKKKKKKTGEQPGPMRGGAAINKDINKDINKENAREEISRLQKAILTMQTEKEFIKSSYESGIAKYWDLEKEIHEMQEQVVYYQDKFDESAVIEDDDARALMTATALKSCEDTIVRLQEQRKTSASQAEEESERVKILREKLKAIVEGHGKSLPDYPESNKGKKEMGDVYHVKLGEVEMQTIVDKIKEHFERGCNISMEEITEEIDELVDKVVDLELMVSSQTSQIDRLRKENSDLENTVQSLQEENSGELDDKLKQVQEELIRVQTLESSFHKDESTIRSNFTEAISRFSYVSETLQSPVCQHHSSADEDKDAAAMVGLAAGAAQAAAGTDSSSVQGVAETRKLQVVGNADSDKALLAEYNTLLGDYDDAKRRLSEVEKKNQDCLTEISKLRALLAEKDASGGKHRRAVSFQRKQSLSSIARRLMKMGSPKREGDGTQKSSDGAGLNLDDLRLPAIAEAENLSPLEEKFRKDIDTLLEENLVFWMKFSSSLQRVQEFQSKYDEMQKAAAAAGDDGDGEESAMKGLRSLRTELQVWSEQNAMLRGELQCRFTSLCDIQEEITAALEMEEGDEAQFTSYSAGKFQGEVLNMQQENNRVSDELQAGMDHVKALQAEIEQKLQDGGGLPSEPSPKPPLARLSSKKPPAAGAVPLQSFLFPTKPKKPSLLARVTPNMNMLHKQPKK